jgi:hypothetical protein
MLEAMLNAMPDASLFGCSTQSTQRNATQLTQRIQDQGSKTYVPDAAEAVDNRESEYIEMPSDHRFTEFLAGLTPSRVLRDRERRFTKLERKWQKHTRALAAMKRTEGR